MLLGQHELKKGVLVTASFPEESNTESETSNTESEQDEILRLEVENEKESEQDEKASDDLKPTGIVYSLVTEAATQAIRRN